MALDSLWWRPWVLWSPRLFAWQALHLATSTVTLRGRRGTWRHLRAFCVAGVALLSLDWEWWSAWVLWSPRLFACQVWHLVTSTVAGLALGHIDVHSAWQAWHLVTSTFTLRGRRGTYGTGLALAARLGTLVAAAVCVAGVSLATSTVTLRGRRGTGRHRRAFCVAGVAFLALDWWRAWVLWSRRLFACQAWHLATLTHMLRGKRGIYGITSQITGDIDVHSAWQVWHLRHHITISLANRRAFCVAGVPFMA